MTVAIYVLVDSEGNYRYVGKAKDPVKRLREHRLGRRSWAISCEVLETCEEGDWPARETWWIAHGRSCGWPLENIADGGNAIPDWYTHTEATRAKLRARVFTPEHRARIAAAKQGQRHTTETRLKLSAAASRQFECLEARIRAGDAHRGKPATADRRGKVAIASRALWASEGYREKQRAGMQRPEVKAKMCRQFTAEHRANIGAAGRGRTPWNKGLRGLVPWNKGIRGAQVAWNKGKRKTDGASCG